MCTPSAITAFNAPVLICSTVFYNGLQFLADHTNGLAYATSVSMSVRNVLRLNGAS